MVNGNNDSIAFANKVRSENKIAAIGAVPYAAKSETWLALSSRSLPTKFGTVASLAGDQNKVMHSTKIMAV